MMYRNTFRFSAFAITAALSLFSASAITGGSTQKPGEQTEASLMADVDAIPGVEVVLKMKPDAQPAPAPPMKSAKAKSPTKAVSAAARPTENRDKQTAANKKTDKDGSFSFENVPVGTYNLTFDAPKVTPAMAGKVEYLVIVQQVEAGGNSATITYDTSKPKTARIPIAKIKDGLEFTVGPQPQVGVFQASKSKGKAGAADSQVREPMRSPPPMNLRGKIFLVEIGTTRIVRDQPKAP